MGRATRWLGTGRGVSGRLGTTSAAHASTAASICAFTTQVWIPPGTPDR
ncbi:hypothetical protein [Sorangium sp. So ce854]